MTNDTQTAPADEGRLDQPVGRPSTERVTLVCVLEQKRYRPGDQAPEGYLAWHEWAEVQHKAGLRQKQCGRCGLWRYPQQLSALVDSAEVTGLRKRQPFRRTLETPVCNDCAAKTDSKTQEFECLGEPSLCTNPRGCACVSDSKTPNAAGKAPPSGGRP